MTIPGILPSRASHDRSVVIASSATYAASARKSGSHDAERSLLAPVSAALVMSALKPPEESNTGGDFNEAVEPEGDDSNAPGKKPRVRASRTRVSQTAVLALPYINRPTAQWPSLSSGRSGCSGLASRSRSPGNSSVCLHARFGST